MSSIIRHPAFNVPFSDLKEGLELECKMGNVNKRTLGPLTQYTYTQQCTYAGQWNLFTTVARGIIVDETGIVALPFPKFFNLSENKTDIPDCPFTCYEKVDGSLIIAFFYFGRWYTATKGSFQSDQAIWALNHINKNHIDMHMYPGYTYLFEAVYPENKIVVDYGREELVLLGIYDNHFGTEMNQNWINAFTKNAPFRVVKQYDFEGLNEIITHCSTLPANEEGYVLRYEDGTRVKIKGDEYCRIHRLVSNITPLAIWEMMWKGDNLEFIRKELPEEFLIDFDNIVKILAGQFGNILLKCLLEMRRYFDLTDKELGLILNTLDPDVRKLIFPLRKNNGELTPKSNETLFRMIRPTANRLEGYIPSSVMNRIQDDE